MCTMAFQAGRFSGVAISCRRALPANQLLAELLTQKGRGHAALRQLIGAAQGSEAVNESGAPERAARTVPI
jgi:hypothetical protein